MSKILAIKRSDKKSTIKLNIDESKEPPSQIKEETIEPATLDEEPEIKLQDDLINNTTIDIEKPLIKKPSDLEKESIQKLDKENDDIEKTLFPSLVSNTEEPTESAAEKDDSDNKKIII